MYVKSQSIVFAFLNSHAGLSDNRFVCIVPGVLMHMPMLVYLGSFVPVTAVSLNQRVILTEMLAPSKSTLGDTGTTIKV